MPPRVLLLTHERELTRPTNTGRVVLEALGDAATRIVWRRAAPDPGLLAAIEAEGVALLWPGRSRTAVIPQRELRGIVVVDGTWQEARKIYNRSAYLHALPTITLRPAESSRYALRRNQIGGGLCTAEAVACLLAQHGARALATEVDAQLRTFLGCQRSRSCAGPATAARP